MQKPSLYLTSWLLPMLFASLFSLAQDSTKAQRKAARQQQLKSMIDGKKFSFVAQSAIPMSGRVIQLTSIYTLKMNRDSMQADLPYYGRAYSGSGYTNGSNGVQVNGVTRTYTSKQTNKGWDITIVPMKSDKVSKMYLSISTDGYATLQVMSTTRQSISFNGMVE